jgi:hypothetical protein
MNPKNLEGKTKEQQQDLYEIELIADFEMEYGNEEHWGDSTIKDFDEKWEEIQQRFNPSTKGGEPR